MGELHPVTHKSVPVLPVLLVLPCQKVVAKNHEENRVENHVEERKVQRKREEDVKKGAEEDANKCRRHITMGLAPSCTSRPSKASMFIWGALFQIN